MRSQARKLIRDLSDTPRPILSKELRDTPNIYRIWRAGRWRIACEIDDELQRIRILRVRHKENMEYDTVGSSG